MNVQDDYNRFIRRSIKQAQCNYEDIFADDECACAAALSESELKKACGCGRVMSDRSDNCGCGRVMPDTDDKNACGCEVKCQSVCERNVPVMAFVEMQPFGKMYNEAEALCRGTLFAALDKPFTGRGGCR